MNTLFFLRTSKLARHLVFPALAASLGGCGLFGGGNVRAMRPSPGIPSGQGELHTDEDDNGNTLLKVSVKYLAHPSKVAPDATTYVAWVQPGSLSVQNAGAIKVDDDLEGTLETLTPFRRFAFSVTPEPSARGNKPTHEPVFTADVDLGD